MVMAFGHDTAAESLPAAVLTAVIICINWDMIKRIMPKVPMALLLIVVMLMPDMGPEAVKTSCLQAVFMEPGMAITAAIQM